MTTARKAYTESHFLFYFKIYPSPVKLKLTGLSLVFPPAPLCRGSSSEERDNSFFVERALSGVYQFTSLVFVCRCGCPTYVNVLFLQGIPFRWRPRGGEEKDLYNLIVRRRFLKWLIRLLSSLSLLLLSLPTPLLEQEEDKTGKETEAFITFSSSSTLRFSSITIWSFLVRQ